MGGIGSSSVSRSGNAPDGRCAWAPQLRRFDCPGVSCQKDAPRAVQSELFGLELDAEVLEEAVLYFQT